MKKRILLISPYFPYPSSDGGKVRIFNLIKSLSLNNEISLLSYVETAAIAEQYVSVMEKYCKKVFTVVRDENKRLSAKDIPRSPAFCYTQAMIDVLGIALKEVNPDIVQIDFLIMTQYLNHIKNVPVVYTEHDMSSVDFEQSFHDRDLPEKLRYVEWVRLVEYQKRMLKRFNGVIVLTERDQKVLEQFQPGIRSEVITTGVDINYFTPLVTEESMPKNVIFVGHYKHYPNYDAVKYFMANIWPSVKKEIPKAKFFIVGSGAGMNVQRYADIDVIVTGTVDDIRKYLADAAVFVAPVRLGGGIKGKVLEAMASGVPVVATDEVCAGLKCKPGVDILAAKNSMEFIDKTILLLNSIEERKKIAINARKNVERNYDWNMISEKLDLFYDSVISGS